MWDEVGGRGRLAAALPMEELMDEDYRLASISLIFADSRLILSFSGTNPAGSLVQTSAI